ncbi:hypothetical protein [Streptomyces sp. NPDC059814]|uniref:hypothetical protein n=1 Tax=Streptomyces sp. NPDC059814 TaxID=3346959 RepID=UPI003659EB9B
MNHDVTDVAEARYELVISVDARRSGEYDDIEKTRMRARIYRVLETAFTHTKIARDSLHLEDRGDGVLVSVSGQVPVARLLGLWMVEVHEKLRDENRALRVPLGLRVGMHVGPVRHDDRGIAGRAVDLACRLADSAVARQLLDAEQADLVLVVSRSLYEDVVSGGGKFIEPARYSAARLKLKEGDVTAWFHLPGRSAPAIAADDPQPANGTHTPVTGAGESGGGGGGRPPPPPAPPPPPPPPPPPRGARPGEVNTRATGALSPPRANGNTAPVAGGGGGGGGGPPPPGPPGLPPGRPR